MGSSFHIYVAIIDDDESLGRSLSRLLRSSGFLPVTYPSAETFLADSKRPQFDCLVVDVELDGMSGVELSRRLAAAGFTIPVIFNTAHDDPQAQKQALRTPCAAFLHKNQSGEVLVNAIMEAIRSASLANGE